jgi:hypothetical protein
MAHMPIDADDLARTALAELIPRQRYRTSARTDARFASFAPLCVRVAFQHLGARPSLLLFTGPGQDPREAARLAAAWAADNWRPSAIQRRVEPSVVAVHVAVAPTDGLSPAGLVEPAAGLAVVWAVDAATGHLDAPEAPAGGPSVRILGQAARDLAAGHPAKPIAALDIAERDVMQGRRRSSVSGGPGIVGLALVLLGVRFAFTVFGDVAAQRWVALPRDGVLLAGVVGAAALAFDVAGLRSRLPGFSSSRRWLPLLSWLGYIAVVVVAALLLGLLEPGPRQRA